MSYVYHMCAGTSRSQKLLSSLELESELVMSCLLCWCWELNLLLYKSSVLCQLSRGFSLLNLEPLRTTVTLGFCGSESVSHLFTLVSLTYGLSQGREVLMEATVVRRLERERSAFKVSHSSWQNPSHSVGLI